MTGIARYGSSFETIVALASPGGAARRAVIRLSGDEAIPVAAARFDPSDATPSPLDLKPGRRHPGRLRLDGWPPIPCALYLFRGPRSYTCEDMVELHLPGSPPLVRAVLRELTGAGLRGAGPGEFTRRAFLNGRLDLTRAEAVLALTGGEQAREVRLAARTLRGGVAERIDVAKSTLLELAAYFEAGIDFSEDEIELISRERALALLFDAEQALRRLLASAARFRVHRDEALVVLTGPANVGKSTLLNALLGEDRVLTSDEAGTTRDAVAVSLHIGDRPVRLLDVAGAKDASDAIESEALRQAADAVTDADIVLELATAGPNSEAALETESESGAPGPVEPRRLRVLTKRDLRPAGPPEGGHQDGELVISAKTGEGLDALREAIAAALEAGSAIPDSAAFATTARQESHIRRALSAIARVRESLELYGDECWELAMVDLREALDELGEVTGAIATDDILDLIFGAFCIGK